MIRGKAAKPTRRRSLLSRFFWLTLLHWHELDKPCVTSVTDGFIGHCCIDTRLFLKPRPKLGGRNLEGAASSAPTVRHLCNKANRSLKKAAVPRVGTAVFLFILIIRKRIVEIVVHRGRLRPTGRSRGCGARGCGLRPCGGWGWAFVGVFITTAASARC